MLISGGSVVPFGIPQFVLAMVSLGLAFMAACVLRFFCIAHQYSGYPGPWALPLVGNILLIHNQFLPGVFKQLARQYGKVYRLFLGHTPMLVVSDCDVAREIMVKKFKEFHDRPCITWVVPPARFAAVTSGIVQARGELWSMVRGASMPVFHSESLSRYAFVMNSIADTMLGSIAEAAERGGAFDILRITGQMAMRVILNCALGVDAPTQTGGKDHPIVEASKVIFIKQTVVSVWAFIIVNCPKMLQPCVQWLACTLSDLRDVERARDVLYSASDQLCRSYCDANGLPPFPKDLQMLGRGAHLQIFPADTVPLHNSILASIMQARRSRGGAETLRPGEVLEQAATFIVGGYETTAMAAAFTVYLLTQSPAAEARLLREIDRHGHETAPTYETLDNWPYAKACVQESLRMYPVIPAAVRECVMDGVTVRGQHIPKGTHIVIDVNAMGRDPDYFPNPAAFRPERFLEGQPSAESHPAYMPFGAGPRACIGFRMAMEEAVIMLIRMYQKFVFRLSDVHHPNGVLELKSNMSLSAKDGIWVTAIPR